MNKLAFTVLALLPAIAAGGNPCCYRSSGRTYYYATPAAAQVQVNNYAPQAVKEKHKDAEVSDEDLAGELARRIGRYEAGLRALGGGIGSGGSAAYSASAQAYASQGAPQYQPQAVIPYAAGSTAYGIQSIDLFGVDAFDKLAKLIDTQQRLASQTSTNSQSIALGVQGQIDSLADGVKEAQAAGDAAREIAAKTDAIEVLGAAMVQMAQAARPEPRASIRTNQFFPQVAPQSIGPAPPAAAGVDFSAAAVRVPTVQAVCGKCHTGPGAKAGLILDGSQRLGDKFALVLQTAVIGKTPSGSAMPPAGAEAVAVTDSQRVAIVKELCELR